MRHEITFQTVGRCGRLEIEVDGKPVFDKTWVYSFHIPVSMLKMIEENEPLPGKLHDMIQESKNNDKRYYLKSAGMSFRVLFGGLNDRTWEVIDTESEERYYISSERELYENMLLALWVRSGGY